jgi:hypothetical protein
MLAIGLWLLQEAAGARAERVWEGTVRDALSGAALAGVQCELWTEALYGPPESVARTVTGADGSYALDDRGRGDKLVLRKSGYRSTETGSPEDELLLQPAGEPFTLRVLDLEGVPIAGAIVRTRQSCRHAVPAVEASSDASGFVAIHDLPATGDLEVLAAGFGALGKLGVGTWDFGPELYLPRRLPVRLRLLDERGRPLPARSGRYDGESGGFPLEIDVQGRATLDTLFDDRDGGFSWRQGTPGCRSPADPGDVPALDREWTLRCGRFEPERSAQPASVLHVVLDAPPDLPDAAQPRVFCEEGWVFREAGRHDVPAGALRVAVGSAFSGVRERVTLVELAPGEARTVALAIEPEPELRVLLPDGWFLVHVQAGDDSVTLGTDGGELTAHVPPGEPVVVLAQGATVRRARLAPWSGTATADLRAPGAAVAPR